MSIEKAIKKDNFNLFKELLPKSDDLEEQWEKICKSIIDLYGDGKYLEEVAYHLTKERRRICVIYAIKKIHPCAVKILSHAGFWGFDDAMILIRRTNGASILVPILYTSPWITLEDAEKMKEEYGEIKTKEAREIK